MERRAHTKKIVGTEQKTDGKYEFVKSRKSEKG